MNGFLHPRAGGGLAYAARMPHRFICPQRIVPTVLAVLTLAASPAATATVAVQARFDPAAETWSLRYCRSPALAGTGLSLAASEDAAQQWLEQIEPAPAQRSGGRLNWPAAPACVDLRFGLGRIADANRTDTGYRAGSDLLSWAWTWWLQPVGQTVTELRVELPAGWHFSGPWPRCGTHCYRLGETPWHWPAISVVGRHAPVVHPLGDARIHALLVGRADQTIQQAMRAIPERAGDLIRAAYGRLPVPDLQLLVIPVASRPGADAVVYGQVNRGGLGGVHLLVNPAATAADLDADWVLPHELSHLLHPYLGDTRGRWLSEGLASYYQNLLRSRTGRLAPREAWERLFAGFDRGRKQVSRESLDHIAANMHRNRAYMRVYWSGAAFWFKVDVHLRERGHPGLDRLLERFGRVHLPATRTWPPRRFLATLDAQLEAPFLQDLADEIGRNAAFPQVTAELHALGLRWEHGEVRAVADGDPGLRRAIAGGD